MGIARLWVHYGYANPNVVSIDGQDHLAMVASPFDWQGQKSIIPYQGVVGLDLDTGKRYSGSTRAGSAPSPFLRWSMRGKNRLYIGGGYQVGCALFSGQAKTETAIATEELYKTTDFGDTHPSAHRPTTGPFLRPVFR